MPKKSLAAEATPLVVQEHIQMWGKAIRAQRMVLRLTAAQLASRIGVSVPTVARLEKGDPGVGVGSYLGALFSLGLNSVATPVLNPELWQSPASKRVRPTRMELGDELGYF
ncbi:MAG: helix-turn-helix transcriptional regulator [Limnobacter sp.]|uniref:helix-turn-helix domain-containing protein n=1 Tax=Limnobacter sp. TaxID=2003368 RepID=UPI0032EAD983